jgi:osmotically-inducible protein OsmY
VESNVQTLVLAEPQRPCGLLQRRSIPCVSNRIAIEQEQRCIMATATNVDNAIQQDILDEFAWDPEVEASDVGVEVDDGVVTLTGTVDSYAVKMAAEEAAQRVDGVRAVANDLSVRGPLTHNDTDIAKAAADALAANISIPSGAVDITVQNGKVTLRGEVDWIYQRNAAADSIRYLRGVRHVINLIQVKQPKVFPSEAEVASGIERALVRAAEIDADRIRVKTTDGQVTLSGTVHSLMEKREAGYAAWRAQGVTDVTNNIEVRPF